SLPPDRLRPSVQGCEWLVRLLPELASIDHGLAIPAALPSEQERRLMLAAVERYLSNVGGRAGNLLVLDDVQCAGADTMHVLDRLLRSTGKRLLRLLAAYRSTEVLPGHLLSTLMVDLAREDLVSQLELAPLQPKDAVALVNSVLEGEGLLPPAHAAER